MYDRKADGEVEAHLIALSCSEAPEGFARWTLRLLAEKMIELEYADAISYETVRRLLKKRIASLESKRMAHTSVHNSDFVANMERVLDVYKRPYNRDTPVVCMDESPKQMIKETRKSIKMSSGSDTKEDFEYEGCGVANVFIASEPLKGKRYVDVTEQKTKVDWAKFVKKIADDWYKDAFKITLVMDNLNTHKPAELYEVFEPKEAKRIWDRFDFVYTPKYGRWLNMAEIELNVLMGQCLNRRIDKMDTIKKEVNAWQIYCNNKEAKINWQFTCENARVKLIKLYPSINV